MRILHVSDVYLPRLGGVEMQVHDLATQQGRRGHDVRVLTSTAAAGHADDVSTVRLPRPFPVPAAQLLRDVEPDVLHCHTSLVSPLAWAMARAATRAGVPVVVTMHSVVPCSGPVAGGLRQVVRGIGPGATWTAVSAMAAQALQPLVPRPVAVLPNGVDPSRWAAAHPGTAAVPTVVAVMRLTSRKRALPLVDVLATVRDRLALSPGPGTGLRVVLAGDGPQLGAVQRAVRRHGLQDVVHLPGRLTRTQVVRLLAEADVFLAPAHLESFGIAALEARCAGLPVIAMRDGGVGEFIRDGVEGYLVDDDREMAERTAALLADGALVRRFGRHNLATPTDLGWSCVVPRTIAAYLGAGSGRREAAAPLASTA